MNISIRYAMTNPTTPTIIPTIAICLVLMIPVECASAFGGVEIGRHIASEADIATPTRRVLRPPIAMNPSAAVGSSRSAVPTTARIGTIRFAAAEETAGKHHHDDVP